MHINKKVLFCVIIWLATIPVWAQWAGDGTQANPYQISTSTDLVTLSLNVNTGTNYNGVYFRLTNNLDLGGTAWTSIGTSLKPFGGNFDGSKHVISGLYINLSTNDVGLFGYTNTTANISNLGVITSPAGIKGNNNVGILIGSQNGGKVTNCYVMGSVTGNDVVGGMIGNQNTTPTIGQCFAITNVTGGAGNNGVGGLIGVVRGTVSNSHAWAKVKGIGSVGGLCGAISTNGVVTACYATGDATSTSSARLGGLAGYVTQTSSRLQNSVAANGVLTSSNSAVGRVAGQSVYANTFINNYATNDMPVFINSTPKTITSDISGIDGGSQSIALLKEQMFYSTTVSWNINTINDDTKIWNIWENVNFPYLQTQSSPVNGISFSGTTLQGVFRPDVIMDSISVYVKIGSAFIRLGRATSVNNASHTWAYSDPALLMNDILYVFAYESGKAWPSYPVTHTVCGISPTFNTVDWVSCTPAINLQNCITNLQYADINDVQFSKAGGTAFDANIIPSPTTYSVRDIQTIYARATTNLGCRSAIKSFQVKQTGSLLFKEDFGTGAGCSSTPLGSNVTTYAFGGDLHVNGRYGMCSQLDDYYYSDYWYSGTQSLDHTNPGKGRSLIVNADFEPSKFYTFKINNLCPGTRLYFSAWVFNLVNPNAPNTSYYTNQGIVFIDPDLRFELTDGSTGTLLKRHDTGPIPKVTDPATNWRPYGFEFVTGSASSVTLTLYNNAPGGNGNDLMIDDIEVYLCIPHVHAEASSDCGPTTLTANYTDDDTFTKAGTTKLYGRWLKSATGNPNNPNEWSVISGSEIVMPLGQKTITSTWIEPAPANGVTMYYRFVTGNISTIDNVNCRASSDILSVTGKVKPSFDVSDATLCFPATTSLFQYVNNLQNATSNTLVFSTELQFSSGLISNPAFYSVTAPTRIYVKATNTSNGCEEIKDFLLNGYPIPKASFGNDDTEICDHETIDVIVNLTGTPPWKICYNNGETDVTYDNIQTSPFVFPISPEITTTYILKSVEDAHCINKNP